MTLGLNLGTLPRSIVDSHQPMKLSLPLIFSALALSVASTQAAVLDIASLDGTFPSYTDNVGIPGLTITYTTGDPTPMTTETRGYSPETGGMNGLLANFPDGHLAVGPSDTVVLDFSGVALAGAGVFIALYDLDNNVGLNQSGDEDVTITHGGGSTFVEGNAAGILNSQAHLPENTIDVGPLNPDGAGQITLQANSLVDQDGTGGYFAFTVSTGAPAPVIPEPSSALLGLLGLAFFAGRRRR